MATQSQLRFGKEIEELQIGDIDTLIQNKIDESQNLEYKEPSTDLKKDCRDLAKTISGFLNTDGGILIYGVAEKRQNKHSYPSGIKCCIFAKERLENILKSSIQPWEEETKIARIRSEENEKDGLFVIEVPKSKNPPHMFNHIYYHRLNFQTEPMSHSNVFRAFQTSWIRRRDLLLNTIQPLYSEIKSSCEKIEKYERGTDEQYQNIVLQESYLYDLIDPPLYEMIEEFYAKMDELNSKLGYWANKIATKIINEELCKVFVEHRDWIEKHIEEDKLFVSVSIRDPSGSIRVIAKQPINGALLKRITIKSYLHTLYGYEKVEEFEPYLHRARPPTQEFKITDPDFKKLWEGCKSNAAKNKTYLSIWEEVPMLLTLGNRILELMYGS